MMNNMLIQMMNIDQLDMIYKQMRMLILCLYCMFLRDILYNLMNQIRNKFLVDKLNMMKIWIQNIYLLDMICKRLLYFLNMFQPDILNNFLILHLNMFLVGNQRNSML